jgi:hypothetical protein
MNGIGFFAGANIRLVLRVELALLIGMGLLSAKPRSIAKKTLMPDLMILRKPASQDWMENFVGMRSLPGTSRHVQRGRARC